LYAGLIPLIAYALFASTPYLHIGPVALTSLLIIAGISQIDGVVIGSPLYIELVLLTGLLVGILQFFLGIFNLGITANFLSRPVISGFTSAAAIIITAKGHHGGEVDRIQIFTPEISWLIPYFT
jgi:SulP family sulfate permease